MAEKSRNSCKLAAAMVIIINLFAMTLSAIFFGLSLWMISSPTSMSHVIQNFGGKTIQGILPAEVLSIQTGLSAAVIAMFVFCISYMGVYGALTKSQFLLFMYATLVLLLFLLESCLVFYFTTNFVEKGIQESDGQWAHLLRMSFQCCDFNRTESSTGLPAWSCCGSEYYPANCTVAEMHPKDCQKTISNWLDKYQSLIYTSLAVVHIVLASCALLRRSCSASRSHS